MLYTITWNASDFTYFMSNEAAVKAKQTANSVHCENIKWNDSIFNNKSNLMKDLKYKTQPKYTANKLHEVRKCLQASLGKWK